MKKPPKGIGLYIRTLRSGEKKYESRLWNPHLSRIGKKKIWQEKDLDTVIELHQALKRKYKANDFEIERGTNEKERQLPSMVLDCAGLYERYLNDDLELVPIHQAKYRSKKHIRETVRYIHTFLKCLKNNGYKLSHTSITAVDDQAVGFFYQMLEERFQNEEIGPVSWNKHIKWCRIWIKTLNEYFGYDLYNPFDNVTAKPELRDPQFLEHHELHELLSSISEEKGWGIRGTRNHRFNYYREWLPSYLLISAFVGGRPSEMASLKWTNIGVDYISYQNNKVGKGSKTNVFIHPELAKMLAPLQSSSKSDEEYVLVPEWTNRNSLTSFVSKAFTHFLRKTSIRKQVTLYNLRHTYVNALYNLIGEEGLSIHHKKETAIKHYLSKKKKLELQEGKTLFQDFFSDFM